MAPDPGKLGLPTKRVLVGLDYETEQPWVWVVDDPDRDAEGYGSQFAVDVPAYLIDEWKAVNKLQDDLLTRIHTAARFDREHSRIGDGPCSDYKGEPYMAPRGPIYDACDACGWPHEEHDHG